MANPPSSADRDWATRAIDRRAHAAARSFDGRLISDGFVSARHICHLGETFARLQALTGAPVTKTAFENTLHLAFEDCGSDVSMPAGRTNPGHDITIDGVRISLKTEAARSIRRGSITISKLMEAAWSKGFTGPADACVGVRKIMAHLANYERIMVLRAFAEGDHISYELVEIPHGILAAVSALRPTDFSALTKSGRTRAKVRGPLSDDAYFTLVFDGSDNKVTVRGLRMDLCLVHATWRIPLPGPAARA